MVCLRLVRLQTTKLLLSREYRKTFPTTTQNDYWIFPSRSHSIRFSLIWVFQQASYTPLSECSTHSWLAYVSVKCFLDVFFLFKFLKRTMLMPSTRLRNFFLLMWNVAWWSLTREHVGSLSQPCLCQERGLNTCYFNVRYAIENLINELHNKTNLAIVGRILKLFWTYRRVKLEWEKWWSDKIQMITISWRL